MLATFRSSPDDQTWMKGPTTIQRWLRSIIQSWYSFSFQPRVKPAGLLEAYLGCEQRHGALHPRCDPSGLPTHTQLHHDGAVHCSSACSPEHQHPLQITETSELLICCCQATLLWLILADDHFSQSDPRQCAAALHCESASSPWSLWASNSCGDNCLLQPIQLRVRW